MLYPIPKVPRKDSRPTLTPTSASSSAVAVVVGAMVGVGYALVLVLISCCILPFPRPALGINSAELRALMEVKAALDPTGRLLPSWAAGRDPCRGDFEGVACNEHGKVANVSLQGKGLVGTLSPAIAGLRCLSGLYVHYNALHGEVPRELGNLTELTDLYLNVNNFSGRIPVEIGDMAGLQVVQLCYNQLTGSIPTQLGLLKKLTVLALQFNHLSGAIPASLGDLPLLMRLDLSFNHLFGSIPVKLAQMPQLVALDVRNNSLSGNVPSELQRLQDGFQYGNNTDLCGTTFPPLRTCTPADLMNPNRPEPFGVGIAQQNLPESSNFSRHCNGTHCSNSMKPGAVVAIVVVVVILLGATVAGLSRFSWYRWHKQKIAGSPPIVGSWCSTEATKETCRKSISSTLISLEYPNSWDPLADGKSGLGYSQEVSQSFRFNLEEVESATQYFSEQNLLGKKGNFVATYKGNLRDGTSIVVKRLSQTCCRQEEDEFLQGLKLLAKLRHENIVGLRGFCCSRGRGECFLVYDFVPNGSLSQFLDVDGDHSSGCVLEWSTRVSIIKGIAKGIEYLHSNRANKPSFVHQNISADKVLMGYNYKPLISGCGLHKLLTDDVVFSTLKESAAMGCLAPEYATVGRFTEMSDIYAFGITMLQILTGRRKTTHIRLGAESGKLEDLIDRNLNGNYPMEQATKLATVALVCTCEDPNQRPTIQALLQELSMV